MIAFGVYKTTKASDHRYYIGVQSKEESKDQESIQSVRGQYVKYTEKCLKARNANSSFIFFAGTIANCV